MIEARVELNVGEVTEQLRAVLTERITRATVFLWQKVQEALNTPNTGERRTHRTRRTPSGRKATHTVYPHPSRPGEAPRKRTGWLQRNVRYEIEGDTGRVGVAANATYGAYLELGTARMRPRPWLVATLTANLARLQAIVRGEAA